MIIYQDEINCGLQDKIAEARIIYASQLQMCVGAAKKQFKTVAAKEDQDLYYVQSILVTSNCNKNDDVFMPARVWAAKDTPLNKPTNLNHEELKIVGHINQNWAVDADLNIIPNDIKAEELPDLFHIVTGSVVYKTFQDKDYKKQVDELIQKIEAGEKYVSMECIFGSFDYALYDSENFKIVARNENTSWLTKYLRAYGGAGKYTLDGTDYKVARLLNDIRFIAHGYVDRPANDDSIIFKRGDYFDFTKAEKSEDLKEKGVLFINEVAKPSTNSMENKVMANEIDNELKNEVKELKAALAKANEQLANAGVAQYEAKIAEANKSIEGLKGDLKVKADELKASQDSNTELTQKLTDAETKANEYKTQLDAAAAAKVKADRISTLVDGGFDKETATAKVEKFAKLNADEFKEVADELISAKKSKNDAEKKTEEEFKKASSKKDDGDGKDKEDMKDEKDDAKDEKKSKAASDALDNIDVKKEVDLGSNDAEKNTANELRKSIASLVSSQIKKGRK